VIVSSFAGGYDTYGWAPDSKEPVFDISLLRPPGLPLVPEALRMLALRASIWTPRSRPRPCSPSHPSRMTGLTVIS
jgi:hypothetical protein